MEEHNPGKYNFLLEGSSDKAALLIHGITGTPSEMRYLARKLHKVGFTVMCNTLPRHCSTLGELKKVKWQEIVAACREDLASLKKRFSKIYLCGLSMGALVAVHLAYEDADSVRGIIALAPTMFYDGWAISKAKILMNISWHIPWIRMSVNIRETWPYGLKDEYMREHMHRFYKNAKADQFDNKVLLFGSPFFPMACLYEHSRFVKVVKKEMPFVKAPALILHAREDDMVSIKNAEYLLKRISSHPKSLVVLDNSYHMITIDNDKDKVVEEVAKFINNN